MTADEEDFLSIELLSKKLKVKCPKLLQAKLQCAVDQLERRLRQTQALEADRPHEAILAITALNLMFENLDLEQEFVGYQCAVTKQANRLIESIDQVDVPVSDVEKAQE